MVKKFVRKDTFHYSPAFAVKIYNNKEKKLSNKITTLYIEYRNNINEIENDGTLGSADKNKLKMVCTDKYNDEVGVLTKKLYIANLF